ncbi:GtrA family protein [Rhodoferax sp. TBRC 17198]|uniref:GtrA family protein n=1 Tax=Rhodoferax potami TaxID=3068338 RepID=UPI0028BE2F65|nr:GtrA family protein [Rhodoferax sp. TBRC 17198]MDT7521969.1 GtrA family protein [Rhodoferax sp. TBRC 17198]
MNKILVIKYILFSGFATVVNLLTQEAFLGLPVLGDFVFLSILAGTIVGLLLKYFLDKHFIFGFMPVNKVHDSKVFVLYTTMGIFTTLVFWSIEMGFYLMFDTKEMRYVGGVIGLGVGYLVKYHLDKRYVFSGEVV